MPNLDNFGGPTAWDAYCSEQDAYLRCVKVDDPGCGTCAHFSMSEYSDHYGMCLYGFYEAARRWRDGLTKCIPIPELVEARGCVPCEYEYYQEG